MPTTIQAVAVVYSDKAVYQDFDSFGFEQKTSFRLDGLTSETLFMELRRAMVYADVRKLADRSLRAKANLATGKIEYSKEAIKLPA